MMLRILILVLALVAGGVAAWLAFSMAGEEPAVVVAPQPPVPMGEVLVATEPLQRGVRLVPDQLEWRPWPQAALAPDFVTRSDRPDARQSLEGWILRSPFAAGEPLRLDRLSETDSGLMSLILDPGMRAMALRVEPDSSAGGFVLPNDRVDLVHTTQADLDLDGTAEPLSRTIIENVRVLAVDQVAEGAATDGGALVGKTITIELTPQQVEYVEMARDSGRISLSLRSVSDFGETTSGDVGWLAGQDRPAGGAEEEEEEEESVAQLRADLIEQDQPEPAVPPVDARTFGIGPEATADRTVRSVGADGEPDGRRTAPVAAEVPPAPAAPPDPPPDDPPEPAGPRQVRIIGSGRVEVITLEQPDG